MQLKFYTLLLAASASALPDYSQGCVSKVPEGANPAEYNLCREHPLGHDLSAKTQVMRTQSAEEIALECGSLGVMVVPEGENPSKYRKCRDHPLGHDALPKVALPKRKERSTPAHFLERRRVADLEKRACYWGDMIGCQSNYCWTRCGDYNKNGSWCWLAIGGGKGEWMRCSVTSQCTGVDNVGCGGNCSC